MNCPRCDYDGNGMYDKRYGYSKHTKQINPENPFKLLCGNCSEPFDRKEDTK